jgi:type I restriction enzyme S subunit
MSWKTVRLGDVFSQIKNGASIKQTDGLSGIPITRIETISNSNLDLNKLGYADIIDDTFEDFYLENGDVLMSHINSWTHLGKNAIIENIDRKIIHGMNLLLLKANKDLIFPKYSKYFFDSDLFRNQLNKISNQSVNQSSFSVTKLRELQIPLPPLPTQKRIAEILDAADALKRKDQELLKKYDELAQAIFIDMFGDPVKNEKGWEVKKLDDVCTKITDGTHDTPERLTEGVKFITGKHIRPYVIDYENSDYVTSEVHKEIFRRCNPEYGDILYTNIGVNYATAAMNIVKYEFSMKNVALLKYDRNQLRGRFLEYQLNNEFFKDKLKKLTGIGGAQQFLSLAQIKSIPVLVPSINLQNEFENKINALFLSIGKQNNSIKVSDNLFQTLIQKAFKGELVS